MSNPSLTYTRHGARRVELYVPFEWEGKMVKAIEIGPCRLDHLLRWQQGEFKTAIELLAEMCGVPEMMIRQLCYPDTDRVLAAYVDMVPPPIQADIGRGAIPALYERPPEPEHFAEPEFEPEAEPEAEPEPKEPGWPYQGEPPEPKLELVPPQPREDETVDLDLVGER